MSATYDQTHPTARDRVRANLGDTAVTLGTTTIPEGSYLHSNAHMDAVLTAYGEPLGQAALAHELWARFAQDPSSITLPGLGVSFANLLDAWIALAKPWLAYLEERATQGAAATQPARVAQIGIITAGTTNQLR